MICQRFARRWCPAATLLAIAALGAAPLASAGGDFVDLAVGSSHVWFVGEPGVKELDSTTGKTVWTTELADAPYPQSVVLAGGAAWIAGVQNGDVGGTLTRIDLRTHSARVIWRVADGAVFYLAAGGGDVWALGTTASSTRIARFDAEGNLSRVWKLPPDDDGRMTADASGCWISTATWLIHISEAGRVQRVLQAPLGDLTAGAGAIWLPETTSVLQVDERTAKVRTLSTSRLRLGGFQHDFAAADDALWALQQHPADRNATLERLNPQTGRITGSIPVPGIADAVVVKPDAIWIATVVAPANKPATGYDLIRINPHTLRRELLVHTT